MTQSGQASKVLKSTAPGLVHLNGRLSEFYRIVTMPVESIPKLWSGSQTKMGVILKPSHFAGSVDGSARLRTAMNGPSTSMARRFVS